MSFNITIRLLGMALFGAAGFFLAFYLSPLIYGTDTTSYNELVPYLTLFGAILGLIITPYITIYPLRPCSRCAGRERRCYLQRRAVRPYARP